MHFLSGVVLMHQPIGPRGHVRVAQLRDGLMMAVGPRGGVASIDNTVLKGNRRERTPSLAHDRVPVRQHGAAGIERTHAQSEIAQLFGQLRSDDIDDVLRDDPRRLWSAHSCSSFGAIC